MTTRWTIRRHRPGDPWPRRAGYPWLALLHAGGWLTPTYCRTWQDAVDYVTHRMEQP